MTHFLKCVHIVCATFKGGNEGKDVHCSEELDRKRQRNEGKAAHKDVSFSLYILLMFQHTFCLLHDKKLKSSD